MGAVLRLPWRRLDRWLDDLQRFRAAGFKLVALTPASNATSLHEFTSATSSADRLLLLLGAEGSGLTPATLEFADIRVRIPVDTSVDSLNVVVAASIALERLR
jgi:tRNA G18 (ribose-2'-O)-methylase SpoU